MTARIALVGACGRMGTLIIRRILATEGLELSAAFDLVNIGKDIGEVINAGALGVPVSDPKNLASVLKESRTDVLVDFTKVKASDVEGAICILYAAANKAISMKRMKKDALKASIKMKEGLLDWEEIVHIVSKIDEAVGESAAASRAAKGPNLNDVGNSPIVM